MDKIKLRNQTVNSIIWKFLERLLAQGVSFVVTVVLARILTPDDYSVVSIVTVFFAFCNIIITGGLNTSLIRKKDSDIVDYSTIFFFSMLLASILYICMFCASPYIAILYDKPLLKPVIRVMGIIFFVFALKSVVYAYVAHNLQFKKFFWATLFGTLLSAVVGIALAMRGYGTWALIAQQLTNNIVDVIILLLVTRIKFRFVFSVSRLKYHINYSWKIFVASVIDTSYNQIKPLIIGIKYTTRDLAYYNKGDNFPTLVNTTISNTMSSVLFASFSKLQDDKASLLAAVRRYIKLSSYIMFPAMMGLFIVAEPLVQFLLTEKWLPVVPFMRIFCVVYMFDLIHVGNLHAIKALGRTDISLKLEIIKKTIYFALIIGFVAWSKSTIAFAFCNLACSLVGTIVNTYPNRKLLGYKYRYQFVDIAKTMLCTILMIVLVWLVSMINIHGFTLLIVQLITGVLTYILFSVLLKNDNLWYILDLLKSMVLKDKKK